MPKTRVETDSLGEIRVPRDAVYGAQTVRALHSFQISGRTCQPELIRAYLRLKKAAATANSKCGALSAANSRLIRRAADRLLSMPESSWPAIFPVDAYQAGAGTNLNMNVNEVLANLANRYAGRKLGTYAPIHPNDHVNRSQSTNDTFPTAMRLALLEASGPLAAELDRLARALAAKAARWKAIPKAGRTHLQDAVPMRLGREVGAWALTIERCADGVRRGRDGLRELGIGGSAAGTALNVPRGYRRAVIGELRRLAGEKVFEAKDLVEAMQSQAPVANYSAAVRATALELTRICNDIRLLASGPMTGLAELRLPSVQPGSSIMPGKVNPSVLEMMNQTCYSALGYDHTVALCTQAGQLELNVMMPMMAYSALEATRVMARAVAALRERAIDGLEPDHARLRGYFERTPQVATALNPVLGYERVAKLVQEAVSTGQSVVSIVRKRRLVDEATLGRLLNVEALVGE